MSELEARFRVRLEGSEELSSKLKKVQGDAKEFQKAMVGAFKDAGSAIAGFAAGTAKSLASLALGNVGIAAQAKNVLAFRDSVAQLTVTAGLGADKMAELRDEIHKISKSSNQMQDDVTEALGAFVAKTGDIETARRNLELYGKVATATGASIKDVAYVGAELSSKLGIKDQKGQEEALAILTQQGKMGAVEIRDLATKAPRIFSAAASKFGVEGIEGLRGTGALAQVFASAHGGNVTAGVTATNITQMFTDMQKASRKIKGLIGKDTHGMDPYEVLKDMIRNTGGDTEKLLKSGKHGYFSPTSLAGIGVMAKAFTDKKKEVEKAGGVFDPKTMGFENFDRFKNVSSSFANVQKDFETMSSTGQARLKASQISVAASSDKNLGESFDRLANKAHYLSSAFEYVTRNVALSASVAGLGLVGSKVAGAAISTSLARGLAGQATAAASNAAGAAVPAAASMFATLAAPIFAGLAGAAIGLAIGTVVEKLTGGKASSWLAKKAGEMTQPSRVVDDYVAHKQGEYANKSYYGTRRRIAAAYDGGGHGPLLNPSGAALTKADDVMKLLADFKQYANEAKQLNIQVEINKDEVSVLSTGGTRSNAAKAARGAPVRTMVELGPGE